MLFLYDADQVIMAIFSKSYLVSKDGSTVKLDDYTLAVVSKTYASIYDVFLVRFWSTSLIYLSTSDFSPLCFFCSSS